MLVSSLLGSSGVNKPDLTANESGFTTAGGTVGGAGCSASTALRTLGDSGSDGGRILRVNNALIALSASCVLAAVTASSTVVTIITTLVERITAQRSA